MATTDPVAAAGAAADPPTAATSSSPSASASPQWPPVSISIDTDSIIDECELMEMSVETSSQPFLAVVEMAALLYNGDLLNARHLWRRCGTTSSSATTTTTAATTMESTSSTTSAAATTNDQYLQDWWNVGRHMMEMNINGVWEALHKIATQHPVPICGYAHQVVHAYRIRLLEKFAPRNSTVTPPLGFNNTEELHEYLRKHGWQPQQQQAGSGVNNDIVLVPPRRTQTSSSSTDTISPEDLTAVVSFLETTKLNN
mmetsp:Transcript_25805/g.36400  ORF Transcript_25805/g.36400 Transcript_25805/m.36400 type:complete len:256 (+) Transcript_25805:162-929(+)